ncbi:MAG: DEAD/DEAH box helicase [Fibrobacter sp.]|nr:DEAD/DEAH box helicase [Fibrobacter sp.]
MSEQLITVILFDGFLSLEWEDCSDVSSDKKTQFEHYLYKVYKNQTKEIPLKWLISLGLYNQDEHLSPSLRFWHTFSSTWIRLIRNNPEAETKRELFNIDIESEDQDYFAEIVPPMIGGEFVTYDYFRHVWDQLTSTYKNLIVSFKGSIDSFFNNCSFTEQPTDRIHFHLVENRKNEVRPFAFLATYTALTGNNGLVRHFPLKAAVQEFSNNKSKLLELLSTVKKIAKNNSLIRSLYDSGELFNPVSLTPSEAFDFLKSVPEIERAGILCRIPRWWKGVKKSKVSLSIGNTGPSRLDLNALLTFDSYLTIDNETLSVDEARKIIDHAQGLAFIKGKWIPVDIQSLQNSIDLFEKAKLIAEKHNVSFAGAMKILAGVSSNSAIPGMVEISYGEWMHQLMQKLTNPALLHETKASTSLTATLRTYQQHGLNWLCFLHELGLGICLADDMGLGKTIQVLALLQLKKAENRCSLIIVPSSLVSNWQSEIAKFTPDLKVKVLHPQGNEHFDKSTLLTNVSRYDIAITTYGMIQRIDSFDKQEWFYIICDEAQAIKNPGSKQTVAVKKLKSQYRLVITGTPVENRLSDLWSIFDFVNPGLLGTFKEFKKYMTRIATEPALFTKLKMAVKPYILRRSKADKSIISDLPDKVEMKSYCELSAIQIKLYRKLVDAMEDELEKTDFLSRRGIIFNYLVKCKQLCNHPDHFTGSGPFDASHSGKFLRIAELCDVISDKREKVLIFTQFKEIIAPLECYLGEIFKAKGVTLSGSSTLNQRKKAVELFQDESVYTPFFILSLKAGGTGLNLTAANHVIHFDRWWNPAVENQATDRAYRIGQKKNVVVHKFICKGTIEERIDLMIDDKKAIADEILTSGTENWITEFDNKKITEMFRLNLDIGS